MELMLTGKTLAAKAAVKIGLVNYAIPERHLENAARAIVEKPLPAHKLPLKERLAGLPLAKRLVANFLRRSVAKKADRRHYPAPYALIDLWQGFARNEAANYAAEAESVARLITGSTARNLVRVFLLQEQLKAPEAGKRPLSNASMSLAVGPWGAILPSGAPSRECR